MGFSCYTCGALFTTEVLLQIHIRAQHLEIKHICKYCQKDFRYVGDKSRHEKKCSYNKERENSVDKHHAGTVYTCEQCNKRFKGKWYLDKHTHCFITFK